MEKVLKLSGYIIDVDGVLVRGKVPLPGAVEFIKYLNMNKLKYTILTNNSTYTPLSLSRFFNSKGMEINQNSIFTSAMGVGIYLIRNLKPHGKAFVVGSLALKRTIRKYGWSITEVDKAEAVVVGLDRGFNYNKLKIAQKYILEGAVLIGANPDTSFPAEDGRIEPGGGSILKAVEAASGKKAVIIGKPDGPLVEMVLNNLGTPPKETAFIGDRLDIDVLSAKKYNLYSILVLTGVSGQMKDTVIKDMNPDLVVTDLYELIDLLEKNNQKLKYYQGGK